MPDVMSYTLLGLLVGLVSGVIVRIIVGIINRHHHTQRQHWEYEQNLQRMRQLMEIDPRLAEKWGQMHDLHAITHNQGKLIYPQRGRIRPQHKRVEFAVPWRKKKDPAPILIVDEAGLGHGTLKETS